MSGANFVGHMVERFAQDGHFVVSLYLEPTVIITMGVLVQFACGNDLGKVRDLP